MRLFVVLATLFCAMLLAFSALAGGDKVNNPDTFGVTVWDSNSPPCDLCRLTQENVTLPIRKQTDVTGDLYFCAPCDCDISGPVLVVGG